MKQREERDGVPYYPPTAGMSSDVEDLDPKTLAEAREKRRKVTLTQAWADYLRQLPITFFISIRQRELIRADRLIRELRRFWARLNSRCCQFFNKVCLLLVYPDQNPDARKHYHLHFFTFGVRPETQDRLRIKLKKRFGQTSVYRFDPHKGASYYLAKKHILLETADPRFVHVNAKYRGTKTRRSQP